MKSAISVILFISILMNINCSTSTNENPPGSNPDNTTAPTAAIAEAQKKFMELFRKGDSAGIAEGYTKDAKVMNAGMPAVEGRDSITKFFAGIFRSGPKIIKTETYGTWISQDQIVEEGKWIMANGDGKEYDHGKYLILWKMEDGQWKKFRDCHNSDNAER